MLSHEIKGDNQGGGDLARNISTTERGRERVFFRSAISWVVLPSLCAYLLANQKLELKLLLGSFRGRSRQVGYSFGFALAKPIGRSKPLKNSLRPLSEVAILTLAFDWVGAEERNEAVAILLYLWSSSPLV